MALSLSGIVGGFSQKLTDRIEEEEERAERLAEQQRQEASRLRVARESERRKRQGILDESAGLLKALGYSDSQVEGILEQGVLASEFYIDAGKQAAIKGIDPRTIVNFSTDEEGKIDQAKVTETIESADTPELGALTESAGSTTVGIGGGGTGTMNLETIRNLYAEPDKVETSFSARLAVISQKLARNPNRSDAEALKNEQQSILADLRTMKEAEREEKGSESPSFTVGSVTANINEIRGGAYRRFGFKVGLDGTIEGIDDGNQHLADIAEMNVASQLTTRNSGINDPLMTNAVKGIYDSAYNNLADYAFDMYNNSREKVTQVPSAEEFAQGLQTRQYRIGDVIQQGNNLFVYTGITDPVTNQPFVYYGM